MGARNVAAVHSTWRGLKHRARLLLDRMALVSIDDDDVPVYVASWAERAEFLGKDVPKSDGTPETERARKRAWQAQADAIKDLVDAGAIIPGHAMHNKSGYVREAFAVDILGSLASKKFLDANPGKAWTFSKKSLGAIQEIPWSRNQEEPPEPLSEHIPHASASTTDRAREVEKQIQILAADPHDYAPDASGASCDVCSLPERHQRHETWRAA